MEKKNTKRQLSELNLMDNFLFNEMLQLGEDSEWFAKTLVERITGRKLESVEIISQKSIQGSDTDKHGIALDVYIKAKGEELPSEIYDIEPNNYSILKERLSKRARFYHGLMDSKFLKSGEDYGKISEVVVIFILTTDPFNRNAIKYTIENHCVEFPDMEYNDGAKTIFLYTKGDYTDLEYGKELSDMLLFMENSTAEAAGEDSTLRRMEDMVSRIKDDPKKGVNYMTLKDMIMFEREEAVAEANAIIADKDAELKKNAIELEKNTLELKKKDEEIERLREELAKR